MATIGIDLNRKIGTVDRRSFERPHAVGVRDGQAEAPGGKLDYEFPARSVSVLRMRLR